jgi:hypothetical protein
LNPVKWRLFSDAAWLNDAYQGAGAYITASDQNTGINDGWRHYINFPHRDANGFNTQLTLPFGGNNSSVLYRAATGASWGSWIKLWDSSNLPVESGYLPYGTGFTNPASGVIENIRWSRIGNIVILQGSFYRGDNPNNILSTLPAGVRPARRLHMGIRSIETLEEDCIISVNPDGSITCDFRDLISGNNSSHAFSLVGVVFNIANA